MADEPLYRLEPLDASGVFLGLGAVQVTLLGGSILLAGVALAAGLPLPVVLAPLAAAGAVSFARAGGHPAWEWLVLGWSWLWAGVTRGREWVAPLPLWPTEAKRAPRLPPCLADLEVVEVPGRAGVELGAVHDTQRHTLTALVPVRGAPFVLEAPAEQELLVAGWGEALAQFAVERGPVAHVSWSDLVRPSGLAEHLAALGDVPTDAADQMAQASYEELLDACAPTAVTHEVVVSVTVAAERLRRGAGDPAEERLGSVLASGVEGLRRALSSVGLEAGPPLDAAGLHGLLRLRVDPTGGRQRRGRRRLGERLGLVVPATAGPLAVKAGWSSLRIDGAWHRTWWVESWPRLAVPPAWLEPFLSGEGVTRTMTVVMVPVSTYRSRRRINRDLVKLESDAMTKQERGRRVDARHRRATQALLDREQELVAGFAEMGYVGLVSLAATSDEQLEEHSEIVEQLAHQCGMELRLLDGRQDVAWAAALPFGLAPATLRAT